ncbi:hypothetical protein FVEG_16272 [Fusarium verticillioides 7600]|uniref:Uncharacterized protein n=1 Tax=Gibberella moniliformis (strain M3125 / FGSC 7600) TaxID=334819 RepID=W7ML08_GIBM7|nr:hypothetical protein FVEG_16272 [Fusarium verticillioides 7600]EWG48434.1 hypothetical protein FVEG_16272 [Fusarium verticillioides 7600]
MYGVHTKLKYPLLLPLQLSSIQSVSIISCRLRNRLGMTKEDSNRSFDEAMCTEYGLPECCSTGWGVLDCTLVTTQGCLVLLGTIVYILAGKSTHTFTRPKNKTGLDLKRDSPLQDRFALDCATLDHHFHYH